MKRREVLVTRLLEQKGARTSCKPTYKALTTLQSYMNIYTNWLTHLPPLTHTFLHLYSLSFICTHFPSFVLTSLHLYSLTFTLVPYMWASMMFLPYMWATMTFWPTLQSKIEIVLCESQKNRILCLQVCNKLKFMMYTTSTILIPEWLETKVNVYCCFCLSVAMSLKNMT